MQALQYPLPGFTPPTTWMPTPVAELPAWTGAKRVCLDVETRDDELKKNGLGIGVRREGYVCGVSFAIEDGPAHYLPIRHEGGDNLDEDHVWAYLRDQLLGFRGVIVGAGLQYDLDYLWGGRLTRGIGEDAFAGIERYRDVQVAEPLIDELQKTYNLDDIAARYEMPGKDETLLRAAALAFGAKDKPREIKRMLWRLPARYVGPYAEQDARLPLALLRRQERKIEEQELWSIYNLESDVLPECVRMRRRGVRVDLHKVDAIEARCVVKESECWGVVKHHTGIQCSAADTMSTDALVPVFRAIGVEEFPLTEGSATKAPEISIDKTFLESIKHPVAKAVLRARAWWKLRTTFCKRTREHAVDGRIHPTFHQLRTTDDEADDPENKDAQKGGRFGRFSCVDPNLQQEPARDDEFGAWWRSIYLAEAGEVWVSSDWSQQEPRVTIHYGELCLLPGARDIADRYRRDPYIDNHTLMAQITGLPRKIAKNVFLALCYGMGGARMCRFYLHLPTKWIKLRNGKVIEVACDEGQAMIDQFDQAMPFVRMLAKRCEAKALERGYIVTLGGRRCRFPKDESGNYDWTYKALNRLIQGTSADMMKAAIVAAARAGFKTRLIVHDEIDYSETSYARARELAEIMAGAMPINVPLRVDLEVGPSWGTVQSWDLYKNVRAAA